MADETKSIAVILRERDALHATLESSLAPILALAASACARSEALLREVYTDADHSAVIVSAEMPPEPHRGIFTSKVVNFIFPVAKIDDANWRAALTESVLEDFVLAEVMGSSV